MHRAQVDDWSQSPKYVSVPDEQPREGQVRVKVEAVGVHSVVRARAAGKHYSASTLPHVPGIDGVGTLDEGTRVYFMTPLTSSGSISEYVSVPRHSAIPLSQGLDAVQVAALVNPALSSWMSMKTRATLPAAFSVLIIGATSASGKLAVPLARAFGANRVIGAARGDMSSLALDDFITLKEDVDFGAVEVDLVLDYVYGSTAEQFFRTIRPSKPVQYVQIGVLGGSDISLPGALLRSKNITVRGSGPGAWSVQEMTDAVPSLLEAMLSMPAQPVRTAKLRDIETEWGIDNSKERLVIIPEA